MLTPGQIADLRSDKNVRGQIGGTILYQVMVRFETFERAQVLTNLGELALGTSTGVEGANVLWFYVGSSGQHVSLTTNKPEWFADLEGKIDDARRPIGR